MRKTLLNSFVSVLALSGVLGTSSLSFAAGSVKKEEEMGKSLIITRTPQVANDPRLDQNIEFSGVAMPNDVFKLVISFLPIEDQFASRRVSVLWKSLCDQLPFFKLVKFGQGQMDPEIMTIVRDEALVFFRTKAFGLVVMDPLLFVDLLPALIKVAKESKDAQTFLKRAFSQAEITPGNLLEKIQKVPNHLNIRQALASLRLLKEVGDQDVSQIPRYPLNKLDDETDPLFGLWCCYFSDSSDWDRQIYQLTSKLRVGKIDLQLAASFMEAVKSVFPNLSVLNNFTYLVNELAEAYGKRGELSKAAAVLEAYASTDYSTWREFLHQFSFGVMRYFWKSDKIEDPEIYRHLLQSFQSFFPDAKDETAFLTLPVLEALAYASQGNLEEAQKVLANIKLAPKKVAMEILDKKRNLSSKVVLELIEPYFKRMVDLRDLDECVLEEYSVLLFTLPYDKERYSVVEECVDRLIEIKKASFSDSDTEKDDSDTESSDTEAELSSLLFYRACFMLYGNQEDSLIRQTLEEVREVDSEDFSDLLRALKHKGVSRLQSETIQILQDLILRGFECDFEEFLSSVSEESLKVVLKKVFQAQEVEKDTFSSALPAMYEEILLYQEVLDELFKGADSETFKKYEQMISYFKFEVSKGTSKKGEIDHKESKEEE